MKRIILSLIVVFGLVTVASAQTQGMDESSRLAIGVVTPIGVENENSAMALQNTINQALALNGLSAVDSRFMVIPKVALFSKSTTATAPVKFVVELEISLFMADLYTGVIMSQTSFSVKGVGNNESQAYLKAIQNVQARNSKLKTMIINGKAKIMSYFEADGEQILGRVKAHIARGDYRSAIIEASAIPSACADLYNKASELIAQIPVEKKIEVTPSVINNYYYTESRDDRVAIIIK